MPMNHGLPLIDRAAFVGKSSAGAPASASGDGRPEALARTVRDAFDKFVGQTFFSHMIKAMRSTVGRPAYFHGGRAEEMFLSQLDQTMAEKLAAQSGPELASPMFRSQFPELAETLAPAPSQRADLNDLNGLRRP